MVRLVKIKDLEARKRALAEESEVYRQTLRLEIQNLHLYRIQMQRKFSSLRPSNPLLMFAWPLAASLFRRRGLPKFRLATGALMAWNLFRRVRSLVPGLFSRPRHRLATLECED
jgi:hypothetical protein